MPFDEDDQMHVVADAITNVTGSAAATYGANEQAIVNNLVTKLNSALAALRAANIIAED